MSDLEKLVALCVANHTPEELALGWLRYESVRKMNPSIFGEMSRLNVDGETLDAFVTDSLKKFKAPKE